MEGHKKWTEKDSGGETLHVQGVFHAQMMSYLIWPMSYLIWPIALK
jgi:hypothetical protein